MAITINGAGTITGINAGGLPDGCVVADDLATDAVTTVKLDNGSVTDAKLASSLDFSGKTVTNWPLGSGYTWASQITFDGDDTWSNLPTTVTEIVLLLDQLKTTSGNIRIQVGTASALTTSGYISFRGFFQNATPNTARFTDGFTMFASNHTHTGIITLKRNTANNKWHMSGLKTMDDGSTSYLHLMAGRLDMGSNVLEQINVVSTSSGTYSGTISLGYK